MITCVSSADINPYACASQCIERQRRRTMYLYVNITIVLPAVSFYLTAVGGND